MPDFIIIVKYKYFADPSMCSHFGQVCSNSEILRVKFHQRQNQYGLFIIILYMWQFLRCVVTLTMLAWKKTVSLLLSSKILRRTDFHYRFTRYGNPQVCGHFGHAGLNRLTDPLRYHQRRTQYGFIWIYSSSSLPELGEYARQQETEGRSINDDKQGHIYRCKRLKRLRY